MAKLKDQFTIIVRDSLLQAGRDLSASAYQEGLHNLIKGSEVNQAPNSTGANILDASLFNNKEFVNQLVRALKYEDILHLSSQDEETVILDWLFMIEKTIPSEEKNEKKSFSIEINYPLTMSVQMKQAIEAKVLNAVKVYSSSNNCEIKVEGEINSSSALKPS